VTKSSFDVIINATPLGMGSNRQSPLEDKELNTKYLFDLVYVPAETKLMKMARTRNIEVISGLEMFVQQGARQFEIWTGKPAPIAEMSFVVSKALERLAAESGGNHEEPTAPPPPPRATSKPAPAPTPRRAKPSGKKKAKVAEGKPAKKAARKVVRH
jgi:3-dehydroquinate dehydratase/shikimate dehydrogenase